MEGNTLSIPTNATVPLTDVLRARVSNGRVAMPVRGSMYARLQHINAVPSLAGTEGYSFSRLQAIDSLLARISASREEITPEVKMDALEQKQVMLEEAARIIAEEIENGGSLYGPVEGMFLDMTA